jgi:hypothetical protein
MSPWSSRWSSRGDAVVRCRAVRGLVGCTTSHYRVCTVGLMELKAIGQVSQVLDSQS